MARRILSSSFKERWIKASDRWSQLCPKCRHYFKPDDNELCDSCLVNKFMVGERSYSIEMGHPDFSEQGWTEESVAVALRRALGEMVHRHR